MKYVTLGRTGEEVSRIGFGGFPISAPNHTRGWDPYTQEGRATAIRTVRRAVELGINYIDTAAAYGDGHSESIIGEAISGRRDELFIATKVVLGLDREATVRSVHDSLRRLGCDHLDLIQFHGGIYTDDVTSHVLEEGPMDALLELRKQGEVRFIGATTEEPYSLLPLMRTGLLDVVQIRYNLIYQSAAHHVLDEAREQDIGVTLMRPLTSGIFQYLAGRLLPELASSGDLYEACLKYVLSDSRVHVPNVGMRWPEEVEKNVRLVDEFERPFDVAELPRGTNKVYDALDAETAAEPPAAMNSN
ncbi:MAG: aldo/keto reductase [Candidatus Brocadiae bacterium]|nr:aldo/keto reductase [Candidatus Brocadiia bacterium]